MNNNDSIIARIKGVPAQKETPQSKYDPRNPNKPETNDNQFWPDADANTPTQAEFIRRLASLPHTADDGPATVLEMGGALGYLNDAIQVAREIVKRDGIAPGPGQTVNGAR